MENAVIFILIFFVVHWYASLFFQSMFHHRYAAHGMFTMSNFWEKTFHIGSFITQGSSYLSPYAYGVMHRLHHAFADTEEDPHSPIIDKDLFRMMWRTRRVYMDIDQEIAVVGEKFKKGVPKWRKFDKFAESRITRLVWVLIYVAIFVAVGAPWWLYFLLPFIILMSPVHGVIVNWYSHKYGYRNYEVKDTSHNLFPVDLLMWGESLHNNHHKFGGRPNFAVKWYEFDPLYPFIWLMDKLRIIRFKNKPATQYM
ncbi:acyl-CoA desaturase [Moheibacter stercoris]|uniref:Stearoyl-CoA desaturase (Delta-9 desaturase) n=1 Tax=Moheibacter stercoris TaxID=1628251 RepID=A0ABV2LS69_9FLAO